MDLFEKCGGQIREFQDQPGRVAMFYRAVDPIDGRFALRDGRRLLMLGSNDYLGLTHDPRVKSAAMAAIDRYGSSSCGARINNGTTTLHQRLEEKLAELKSVASVVVFSNGFLAMLGAIISLVDEGDVVFCDQENHASLVDGCRLCAGETRIFRHNDTAHLEELLGQYEPATGKLIVVDGVFSQTGKLAPLPQLVELARRYGARLMLDDAHGTGVLGARGHGTAEHFGLQGQVDLVGGTFSKALGAVGGFLGSSRDVMDFIRYRCRPHLFTAAPPVSVVASVLTAIEIVDREPERRERMWRNVRLLREGLLAAGFDVPESATPITPVVIGDSRETLRLAAQLEQAGIFVNPILPPAVPRRTARLRLTPTAAHTEADIAFTVETMTRVAGKLEMAHAVAG